MPISQNSQTHSNNTNCLSVFDNFVGLALKGLTQFFECYWRLVRLWMVNSTVIRQKGESQNGGSKKKKQAKFSKKRNISFNVCVSFVFCLHIFECLCFVCFVCILFVYLWMFAFRLFRLYFVCISFNVCVSFVSFVFCLYIF